MINENILTYAITCSAIVDVSGRDHVIWAGVTQDQIFFGAIEMSEGANYQTDTIFEQKI